MKTIEICPCCQVEMLPEESAYHSEANCLKTQVGNLLWRIRRLEEAGDKMASCLAFDYSEDMGHVQDWRKAKSTNANQYQDLSLKVFKGYHESSMKDNSGKP